MVTSDPNPGDRIRSTLLLSWSFLKHLIRRYDQDGCRESAAALTYTSLFAVVPLMTLMYSVFSMVPAFQELGGQVNDLIFDNLMPDSGREVQSYLQDFSGQARNLSFVGALILIVTSYLMLANIERTFNNIWGTVGNRKGLSSFLLYWGILSFGPLLLGAGLVMHTYLVSFQMMMNGVDALGLFALVLKYLPWLLTWIAFTMLFVAVPNCKVSHRYAMIGGLFATTMFQLAKGLFGSIVANTSFHSVYGAFALIPLFLFWINLCWMITLTAAELVRSLETFSASYRGFHLPGLTAVVLVLWMCWDCQQKGKTLSDKDLQDAGIEQQHWLELRAMLLKFHFLEVTRNNHYVLTRDVGRVSVWQLIAMFGENFTRSPSTSAARTLADFPWAEKLDSVVKQSQNSCRDLFSITLSELFNGTNTEHSIEELEAAN